MGVGALFRAGLFEWMSTMTYQAASGGGAAHMRELLAQFGSLHAGVKDLLDDPKSAILEIDRRVLLKQQELSEVETAQFGVPLGGSLIPWIDKDLGIGKLPGEDGWGVSREEWKGGAETTSSRSRRSRILRCRSTVSYTARCAVTVALMFRLMRDVPFSPTSRGADRKRQPVGQVVPNNRVACDRPRWWL